MTRWLRIGAAVTPFGGVAGATLSVCHVEFPNWPLPFELFDQHYYLHGWALAAASGFVVGSILTVSAFLLTGFYVRVVIPWIRDAD